MYIMSELENGIMYFLCYYMLLSKLLFLNTWVVSKTKLVAGDCVLKESKTLFDLQN